MDMPRSKNQWPLRRFQIKNAASLEVAAASPAKLSAFQPREEIESQMITFLEILNFDSFHYGHA